MQGAANKQQDNTKGEKTGAMLLAHYTLKRNLLLHSSIQTTLEPDIFPRTLNEWRQDTFLQSTISQGKGRDSFFGNTENNGGSLFHLELVVPSIWRTNQFTTICLILLT